MSASWTSRAAACGHRRCTAARWTLTAAAVPLWVSLPALALWPSWRAAVMFGASVTACFAALAVPCPARMPRRWTRAHWDELERQLSYCPDTTEED